MLHNLCFSFLLGITAVPREIENNAYAEFGAGGGGANKVHYGKFGNGVRVKVPSNDFSTEFCSIDLKQQLIFGT